MLMMEEHHFVVEKQRRHEMPEQGAFLIRERRGIPTPDPIDAFQMRVNEDQFVV